MLDSTLRQQLEAVLPPLREHHGLLGRDLARRLEAILAADPSHVHTTIRSNLMFADYHWLQGRILRIEAATKTAHREAASFEQLLTEIKQVQRLVEELRTLGRWHDPLPLPT